MQIRNRNRVSMDDVDAFILNDEEGQSQEDIVASEQRSLPALQAYLHEMDMQYGPAVC